MSLLCYIRIAHTKKVPLLTILFTFVKIPTFLQHVAQVIRYRSYEQMPRIYTGWIITCMAYTKRLIFNTAPNSESVGLNHFSKYPELSIATSVSARLPLPTIVGALNRNFTPKSIHIFLYMGIAASMSIACSTAKTEPGPVTSLCIFDETFENCWVDKLAGKGFNIKELREKQAACYLNNGPCMFGIDSYDLSRIHSKLNHQGR